MQAIRISRRGFWKIIPQGFEGQREFLGYSRKRLLPGIRWNLPLFHSFRLVDMREGKIDFHIEKTYTADNVPTCVTGSFFYSVRDSEKACYGIDDYLDALNRIAVSSVRTVVGSHQYEKIAEHRNELTQTMMRKVGNTTEAWGIEPTKVEILEFSPISEEVAHTLEKQMGAERDRRATVLTAEAMKDSERLKSEGELIAAKNRAECIRVLAEAQANSYAHMIHAVAQHMNGNHGAAATFIVAQEKMKNLGKIAENPKSSVYVLPDDATKVAFPWIGMRDSKTQE